MRNIDDVIAEWEPRIAAYEREENEFEEYILLLEEEEAAKKAKRAAFDEQVRIAKENGEEWARSW